MLDRLRPLLGAVEDTQDLNYFLSNAVDDDKWEIRDRDLSCTSLAAFSATLRHILQGVYRLIEAYRGAAGLCFAKALFREIADAREIVCCRLRPTEVN